jgi:hypothetical protein
MATSYSIKAAAIRLQLSEVYIRRLISQDKLITNKVPVSDNVWRHEIPESELLRLEGKHSNIRTQREDGRNKYTLYANLSELAQLQQLAKEAGIGVIIERANKAEDSKRRYLAQKAKKAQKAK